MLKPSDQTNLPKWSRRFAKNDLRWTECPPPRKRFWFRGAVGVQPTYATVIDKE